MVERSPGLKVQAGHSIGENTRLQEQLAAIRNANLNEETNLVEIPEDLVISIIKRLEANSTVLQKQDKKIDSLNDQLFKS